MNQLEKEIHCGFAFGAQWRVGGARTIVRERIGVSDNSVWVSESVRWSPLSLFLSLFLCLRVWDPEMVCSENRNVNQFPGQSHKTHGQLKCFSRKFYFLCVTKHTVRCKIISWNGFTPKKRSPRLIFLLLNNPYKDSTSLPQNLKILMWWFLVII